VVYVGNVVSNTVSILDSGNNTVASTVDVNSLPLALEYNPFNNAVYVAGTAVNESNCNGTTESENAGSNDDI